MDDVTPAEAGNNAEATEEVTPQAGEETPKNPTDKVEETPKTDPPEDAPQEHDWKKRFDGVDQAHKKLSEEHQAVIDTSVRMAEKDPGYLENLAEDNPALADKVSEKLHGKSYKDYQNDEKLSKLKDSDPDEYEREMRLRNLEKKESDRVEDAKANFFKEKGIKNSEYDPAYQAVQKQLDLFNPKFVQENPVRALEMAHSLAFPKGGNPEKDKADADLANNTSKGGGMSPKMDTPKPTLSPGAQAFRDTMRGTSNS